MKKGWLIFGGILFALFIIVSGLYGSITSKYNLISSNEEVVFKTWGDVQSALQRRMDLIPGLVEIVKGYAAHEKQTFTDVTEARAKVGTVKIDSSVLNDPAAFAKMQQAQGELSGALSRLMVVVERYPELKANQNFLTLQDQYEGSENRINTARVRYNAAVQAFNTSIRVFPNNIVNNLFLQLQRKAPFEADKTASKAPAIKF